MFSKRSAALRVAGGILLAAISIANSRAEEEAAGQPKAKAEAKAKPRKAHAARLTESSTLAEWKAANASSRSEVAVAIARKKLPPTATKLEIATAAMEISGCLSKTAGDARFDSWQVEPTATTCLTAPEKPAPGSKDSSLTK